jgi:drug/metabolite transporter (DMT)-like permease
VLLGALLAGEAVTVHTVVGGAVIVVAVVLIVSAPKTARPALRERVLSFRHGELAERRS